MNLPGKLFLFCYFGAAAYAAPRIVGGREAPDHKYPYLVSLQDDEHVCAGSILNKHWILTAAHCLIDRDADSYTILAGTNNLDEEGDVYKAKFHIIHEEYENFFFKDIALIRVSGEIVFNDYVKPIRIPDVDQVDDGATALFAGWGSTTVGGPTPNNLQEITLRTMRIDRCKHQRSDVTQKHICTFNQPAEGICHGDSGGALVLNGSQIGIASYIVPCAVGIPDVFTRVYSYREWIEAKIEENENE